MKCFKLPKVAIVIVLDIIAVTIFLIGVINFHFGIKWLPIQIIDLIGQCLNVIPGFSGLVLLLKSKI